MPYIDTIHQEIEQLHRQCMDDLNRMAWEVEDALLQLELIGQQLRENAGLVVRSSRGRVHLVSGVKGETYDRSSES